MARLHIINSKATDAIAQKVQVKAPKAEEPKEKPPKEGESKEVEIPPFEAKFIPLPNTKQWKSFPFGKKSYYPESFKEFLMNYYNYLYSVDFEKGIDLFYYRVIKGVEILKKRLENIDDPKKVEALRHEFDGYGVLLKGYKDLLEEINRFYQAKGEIALTILPDEVRKVINYNPEEGREQLKSVELLKSIAQTSFNEALAELKEIIRDRDRYLKEVEQIYKHPYYSKWLGDKTLMVGGNRLLILHGLFSEKFRQKVEENRETIETLLKADRETVKRLEEVNPEAGEYLRNLLKAGENLYQRSLGGVFEIEKKPSEVEKIGNLAYFLNDNERFRISFLLTELHNLNTLLEKVERGELTDEDIEEIFSNSQLGLAGPGRVFKKEEEIQKVKNFLKKYLETNAKDPVEEPLTRHEYEQILNLVKTSTLEEFVNCLKETDTNYQLKKFVFKFTEAVSLGRIALNPQTERLKLFEKCLRDGKEENGENVLKNCIDRLIRKDLIVSTQYKQIIDAVKDTLLWTSLFSPATLAMELSAFMKVYNATVLKQKKEELLERTQREIDEILSLPPSEATKRAKEFVFKETGIFAELTNPAFVKEKVEKFKGEVVLSGLTLNHLKDLKAFKERRNRIKYWLKGFGQGRDAKELIGAYAKWLTDGAHLPKEIAKEEYIHLHRANIRKARKAFVEDIKTALVVKFLMDYKDGISKGQGHKEAFYSAYENVKKLIEWAKIGGEEEKEIREVLDKLDREIDKLSSVADKTYTVVAKEGKALVLGVNIFRHQTYLENFKRVGEDFEEFLKYMFNINREMIEANLPKLKNPLNLLSTGMVLKGVHIQVNEEVLRRMKEYRPPQGVDLRAGSRFLDQLSEKEGNTLSGPSL